MHDDLLNVLLANAVLILHVAVAAFVLGGGVVLVVVGNLSHWRWINNLWFRLAQRQASRHDRGHRCGNLVWYCVPTHDDEMRLRSQAGTSTYSGGFIEHWLHRLLYFDAPPWVFVLAYSVFALPVAAIWWCLRPNKSKPVKDVKDKGLKGLKGRPASFFRTAKRRK